MGECECLNCIYARRQRSAFEAKFADPAWERGGKEFERCRRKVARELRWKAENVMDWEVRSYMAKHDLPPSLDPLP